MERIYLPATEDPAMQFTLAKTGRRQWHAFRGDGKIGLFFPAPSEKSAKAYVAAQFPGVIFIPKVHINDHYRTVPHEPSHGLKCRHCRFQINIVNFRRRGDKTGQPAYGRARSVMVTHLHENHADKLSRVPPAGAWDYVHLLSEEIEREKKIHSAEAS